MSSWPKYDVELRIDIDPGVLRRPVGGVVGFGGSVNREFADLSDATWTEVLEVLTAERDMINDTLARVKAGEAFEDVFGEAEEEFPLVADTVLDFTVAAAVLALNAIGCPTVYSCNGHHVGYSYITFCATGDIVPVLKECAAVAAVGLINGSDRCAEVFADSPEGLVRFAEALVHRANK